LVEVVIGQACVSVGGNLLQFRHYNTLFTGGRTLSDEEAQRVVDDWFGGIGALGLKSAGVAVEAVPAAVVHEVAGLTMGYGIRLRTLSRVGINGGWLDLLLSGTGEDRSIPLHGELGVMATTEISVAVARMARDGALAIGVSPKLILGNEFIDATLRSTAHVANDAIAHDFEYRVRAAGGLSADLVDEIDFFSSGVFAGGPFRPRVPPTTGLGAGIDAGVTFLPSPGIKLSASVTDLGFVRWSSDAQSIEPLGDRFTFQGLEFDIDRVRDEFGGDVGKYFVSTIDSLASGAYDRVDRTYGAFLATLPTTVHFGASWVSPAGRLVVAGGTSTPITPSTVQISTPPEIHAGLEYTLGDRVRVPLRAGLFLGGSWRRPRGPT
jgi:hypothetical protein